MASQGCRKQPGWLSQALKRSLLHFCEVMTSNCIFCHLDKGHQSEAGKDRFLCISNKRVFNLADWSRSKARSWRKWFEWELKFPKSMHNETYRWGIRGLGGCRWPMSPVSTHLPLLRQHGLLDRLLIYCWASNFIFVEWEFLFVCLNLYHMEIYPPSLLAHKNETKGKP